MKVKVLSEELVKPASSTPPGILELSALDQVNARFHSPPVLAFIPSLPDGLTFEGFVEKSKQAFSTALVAHHPLAGRLVKRDQGCLAIDCNGAGILLRTAEADCALSDELLFGRSVEETQPLFFVKRLQDITTVPLLLLQFTRFQDNSICIYWGFHHTYCDGGGGARFGLYWAEVMTGKTPSFQPVHDRLLMKGPGQSPVPATHPAMRHAAPIRIPKIVLAVLTKRWLRRLIPKALMPSIVMKRLTFPNGNIEKLKVVASEGLAPGQCVSSSDVVAAVLWQSITRARGLDKQPDQVTTLGYAVDIRTHLEPPLPEGYSGNATIAVLSRAMARDLCSQPVAQAATAVRNSVSQLDRPYLDSVLDYIEAQPDKSAVGMNMDPHRGTDLLITMVSKVPIGLMDLGWGRALAVGFAMPYVSADGYVLLASYHRNGGGTVAYVSLLAEHMEKLMKHEPLMRYVE